MNEIETIEKLIIEPEISVTYDVLNQMENGKTVDKGHMPEYTFTIYVTDLRLDECVKSMAHGSLKEGLIWGIVAAKEYIKNGRKVNS